MRLILWKSFFILALSCSQVYAQPSLSPSEHLYGNAYHIARFECLSMQQKYLENSDYLRHGNFNQDACIREKLEDLKRVDNLGGLDGRTWKALAGACQMQALGKTVRIYVECVIAEHAAAQSAGGIPDISRFHVDVQELIPKQCSQELSRYRDRTNMDGYARCLQSVAKEWDKTPNLSNLSQDVQYRVSRACRPYDPKEYSSCVSKELRAIGVAVSDRPRVQETPKQRREAPSRINPPSADYGVTRRVSGTAFAIAPGMLITNQHVVAGCATIEVIAAGTRHTASIVDVNAQIDLGLLRVTGLKGATARLRTPRNVRLGESVTVFGYPLAGSLSSDGNFTTGVVSALRGFRDAAGEIQITAPVQPGNSGGPLMDASGFIIGVVQAKLDAFRSAITTGDIPQNVNFAISLETLANFLIKNGIAFREGASSTPLDTAAVAQLAQNFTYHVECRIGPQKAR